jgi:hypothetical protein
LLSLGSAGRFSKVKMRKRRDERSVTHRNYRQASALFTFAQFTHESSDAAAEFQKILDHRGIVLNSPIGALAHLQISRAYAMQCDNAKAKVAYQDFLTLCKDADPDIPILITAKAEYAKLN